MCAQQVCSVFLGRNKVSLRGLLQRRPSAGSFRHVAPNCKTQTPSSLRLSRRRRRLAQSKQWHKPDPIFILGLCFIVILGCRSLFGSQGCLAGLTQGCPLFPPGLVQGENAGERFCRGTMAIFHPSQSQNFEPDLTGSRVHPRKPQAAQGP